MSKNTKQIPAAIVPEKEMSIAVPLSQSPLVLHRTFEKSDRGEPTYYVVQDGKVTKKEGVEISDWIESLDSTHTVRLTSMGTYLPILMGLKDRGVTLLHANWHKTGVKKGLKPGEIALAFAALDPSVFQEFKPRRDMITLRKLIAIRAAVMAYRIAAGQKIIEETRSLGFTDDTMPPFIKAEEERLKQDVKETETPLEKEIAKLAKSIPECVLLNKILNVSDNSWMTSATVMGYLQDIERFATISKLWHYSGYHVVDGRGARRKRGESSTWNPELKTALWKWCDSMLKTRNPVWRPVYDTYLAEEDARHPVKCSPEVCGGHSRPGHIGARARRRVIKDVLKELWIQVRGGYAPSIQVSPTSTLMSPAADLSATSSQPVDLIGPEENLAAGAGAD